jgi:hypothetical protein
VFQFNIMGDVWSRDCSSALQARELIDDALHHVSTGAANPHHHAVSSECLGQPGREGAFVVSFLSCGPSGR